MWRWEQLGHRGNEGMHEMEVGAWTGRWLGRRKGVGLRLGRGGMRVGQHWAGRGLGCV